jgi:hypothetical protein
VHTPGTTDGDEDQADWLLRSRATWARDSCNAYANIGVEPGSDSASHGGGYFSADGAVRLNQLRWHVQKRDLG